MRSIFVTIGLMLALVTTVDAQNVKIITWTQFVQGVEFTQVAGGQWEFTHAGRALYNYTVVEVPAGAMSVRTFNRLDSTDGLTMYLAALSTVAPVEVKGRDANIRVMFSCRLATDGECRRQLSEHLRNGAEAQSLGVGNSGYENGVVPEVPILSFLVNTSGKFTR